VTRLRVVVGLVGLLGLLAAAGWVLLGTGLLGVRSVEVVGASRVSTAEVLAAAAVRPDEPLASLDAAAIAGRVAALPAVRSAVVVRQWPRAVRITVHERVPAAVRLEGSSFALVDRSGVVFGVVSKRPPGLPLVSAPVDAGAPALRAALDVLAAVPRVLAGQVLEVRAATPDQVTLRLTRKRTVMWGSPERSRRKAAVLAALMTRPAKIYDVSAPDAPTTRIR
jgi:cell division protein FtsQ